MLEQLRATNAQGITGLQVWRTNELVLKNTVSCPSCGLIVIFGLCVSHHSVLLRKLTPGESAKLENALCMMIFPKQWVCGCHHLLVHYEPENLLSLHLVPAELSCVAELPTVRLPTCSDFADLTAYVLANIS